jgi:hypothetical protein
MTIAVILCNSFISHGKTTVPVFLLSGQSNMAGYFGSVNDLSADQRKEVNNVKIYMDGDGDGGKKNKWLTLGPGFGASSSWLGPELGMGRTLSDSMPDTKIAFIKHSVGGTYLAKAEHWLPPSSNNGNGGTLYKNMMSTIDRAIKSFSSAFDTSQYTPRWAGFVWFQGEFDAYDIGYSNAYEKNLTNLIKDIRSEVGVDDLPVILPMIDVQNQWTHNGIVRAADIAVSQKLENVDTVDTKGFPTDGTHYRAAGYIKIGQLCAQRWLTMEFIYEEQVYVLNPDFQNVNRGYYQTLSKNKVNLFDLSGRMISSSGSKNIQNILTQTHVPSGVVILNFKQAGEDNGHNSNKIKNQRVVNLKNH